MSKYNDTNLLCDVKGEETDGTMDTSEASKITVTKNTNYHLGNKGNASTPLEIISGNLIDMKPFCENNKGTCAGVIFVFILIILIAATERSCLSTPIGNTGTNLPIQIMIYKEGTGEGMSGRDNKRTYSELIDVVPHMRYEIKFEVLLNDLGSANEKVSGIKFNRISLGECNPSCEGMTESECDYACTFYDCTPYLNSRIATSGTETIKVDVEFQGHSRDCDCDKNSWECKREDTHPNLSPMIAVARVTLTPIEE